MADWNGIIVKDHSLCNMHTLEPFYRWRQYYVPEEDPASPFYGKTYNADQYSEDIYGYYIYPYWDFMGSETLYIKILYADYERGFVIIEMLGEWNDAINNDIMHFKRNIVDHFNRCDINKYLLIGENVMNFHGSDDSYYEEWSEDMEEGWIVALNFPEFVLREMSAFDLDHYMGYGGELDTINWRTLEPSALFDRINGIIGRRISLI